MLVWWLALGALLGGLLYLFVWPIILRDKENLGFGKDPE